MKKNPPSENDYNQNPLKKSILYSERSNSSSLHLLETILFELDQTILYAVYKKNQIMAYDSSTYVHLFGPQHTFKLYLSYRSYLLDMLSQLKDDFEIILFSAKNSQKYVDKVVEALEGSGGKYFDHIISTEDMYYLQDIDYYILDLGILTGSQANSQIGSHY